MGREARSTWSVRRSICARDARERMENRICTEAHRSTTYVLSYHDRLPSANGSMQSKLKKSICRRITPAASAYLSRCANIAKIGIKKKRCAVYS